MFEKCGFSEENTTWASISHRRARISTDTREILQLLQSTPFAHEAHRGPRRSQQHSERSRGYIFNNTNNEESTIKTIPAVGVCCSPTELLLNKVVYVVVNQILLKLFNKQTPWFSEVPCGSVVKTKTAERCLSAGRRRLLCTAHRRAQICTEPRNISVDQCNQRELMSTDELPQNHRM